MSKENASKITWLRPMNGQPLFAAIPPQLLLDRNVSNAERSIFCVLALHANAKGQCVVSQERLAELLGFKSTRCVSLALAAGDRPGKGSHPPGRLVALGYVKNLGQTGFNQCNKYQLVIPGQADLRTAQERKQPAAQYKAVKAEARRLYEYGIVEKDTYTIPGRGVMVLLSDIKSDLSRFNSTGICELPPAAYAHFGIEYPEGAQVGTDYAERDDDAPDANDFL